MVICCTHCGADLSYRPSGGALGVWPEHCPDCGLAQDDSVPTLAPGDDELEYPVGEWVPRDRILLRNALTDRGVLWRWEPGPVLIVNERDEATVEAVLDDLEQEDQAELLAVVGEPVDNMAGDEADGLAQAAMGDLFVAADRLAHSPSNGPLVTEVDRLASIVEDLRAPYGLDPTIWADVRRLARSVTEAGEAADEDEVRELAQGLRDLLRDYV